MFDLLRQLFEFILHIDKHLAEIVTNYQSWTYLILCIIIFCETGLVVTPLLPGDSLLFAAGAIAALPGNPLSPYILVMLVLIAAFSGDNTNYFIGTFLGHKVYEKNYKLIKREYVDKTHQFYERHGGKTLIIARFMPIIRTFAPFVAGIGDMTYRRFILFSIIGNILWVNTFIWAGYLFGNIPFIKSNFSLVVFLIIFVSLLPTFYAVFKQFLKKWNERKG
jgi:membrane-associated protein